MHALYSYVKHLFNFNDDNKSYLKPVGCAKSDQHVLLYFHCAVLCCHK